MWPFLHIFLLSAIAFVCARVAQVAIRHLLLLALCALALILAFCAAVIGDAHLTHAQLASHPRSRRHQRLFAKTPLLTVAAVPDKSAGAAEHRSSTTPDYRALTTHLQHCLLSRREFRSAVGNGGSVPVHSGLPSADEVSAGGNIIALYCGGSWHGLFNKPSLNRVLRVCGGLHEVVLGFRAFGSLELPFPAVAFDFPGKLAWLNCGQTDDCAVLDYVYQRIVTAHPKARILLMADCLGSLRALNWLGTGPVNVGSIAAICLESPLVKLDTFLRGLTSSSYVNAMAFAGLKAIMPNFSTCRDREYNFAKREAKFFPKVPIFIGLLMPDSVSGPDALQAVIERFPSSRSFVFVARDEYVDGMPLRHGHLVRCASYREALHSFLGRIGLVALTEPEHSPLSAHGMPGAWRPAKSSLTEHSDLNAFLEYRQRTLVVPGSAWGSMPSFPPNAISQSVSPIESRSSSPPASTSASSPPSSPLRSPSSARSILSVV